MRTGVPTPTEIEAFASLQGRADRLGYIVAVWTDEVFAAPVETDHDSRVIAVDAAAEPAMVITALTEVVDAIAADRARRAHRTR